MYKMYKQLANFMDKYFSIFQCTFRKGNSTQQCLIVLIKKWKSSVDSRISFKALLINLLKVFYCLPHELRLANNFNDFYIYDFNLSALKFICTYLFNREYITKINASYSFFEEILHRVP